MSTFVAIWSRPDDPSGFDAHYEQVHLPIVREWPGVSDVAVTRITANLTPSEPQPYLILQVSFDDAGDLDALLDGNGMAAAAQDAAGITARFGATAQLAIAG